MGALVGGDSGNWDISAELSEPRSAFHLSSLRIFLCYQDHTTWLLSDSPFISESCRLHSPGLQRSQLDHTNNSSPAGAAVRQGIAYHPAMSLVSPRESVPSSFKVISFFFF